MRYRSLLIAGLLPLLGCWACLSDTPKAPLQEPALLSLFQSMVPGDTLSIRVEEGDSPGWTAVPDSVLLAGLDSTLLAASDFDPQAGEMQAARAGWRIPLSDRYDACLLELLQYWFTFKYLLLYDKPAGRFSGLMPLASFYGGDGGQIQTAGWLFDFTGDEHPDLVIRTSEHYLRMEAEDPQDLYLESVELKTWTKEGFQPYPVQDSLKWIQAFPVTWWGGE